MTFGTSSCDTTVDSFFDDTFARMRHLYSSGTGSDGLPSRGLGRSCPSSAIIQITYKELLGEKQINEKQQSNIVRLFEQRH